MVKTVCEHCGASLPLHKLPKNDFDPLRYRVVATDIPISPLLWRLLTVLWERRDRFVSTALLMDLVYAGVGKPPEESAIREHISRLRHKVLLGTEYRITHRPGWGYRLDAPQNDEE